MPSTDRSDDESGHVSATDRLIAHPRTVLVLCSVVIATLAAFAPRFEIDASPETLLTEGNEDYVRTRIVNRRFDPREFLIIAYEPLDHPLFSERTARDLEELTDRLRALERVESIRSLLNVPLLSPELHGSGEQAVRELASLEDVATLTWQGGGYSPAVVERVVAGHPLYQDLLVNRDASATALQVLFAGDPRLDAIESRITALEAERLRRELAPDQRAELERLEAQARPLRGALDHTRASEIEAIRAILADFERGARLRMGGAHVLAHELIQIIERDLVVFGAAIAAAIVALLALLFRRARWVGITALCCASGVAATLGLLGLFGLRATVISSSVVALQLILTLAVVVHLIVQYQECARRQPQASVREWVRATMRRKTAPCLYAGLTTSIGFASLVASGLQPVRAFGYMMILAIVVALAVSLILFPAILSLLPGRDPRTRHAVTDRLLGACASLSLDHGRWVAAGSIALLGLSALGISRLHVENSFIDYFRSSTRIHQELEYIDREFGGTTPLDLVYRFDEPDEDIVLDAETVQELQRIQQRLERRPGMGKVLSVVNLTSLAKQLNGGKPLTEYELTAFYRTLEADMREDLLRAVFSPENDQLRVGMRIQDTTPELDRTQLLEGVRTDLAELGVSPDRYQLTNAFVLYEDMLQQLFESQILTLGIVLAALSAVFTVVFRSLRIGLIALAPNLLATAGILGVMGWAGLPLDLMTITVAAIALGIAADDTVHFVHEYLRSIGSHDARGAAHATYANVGYAIVCTSSIIAIGFSLMGFSDFVPTVSFGLLTALAMLLALLADLIVLPALLVRFVPRRR